MTNEHEISPYWKAVAEADVKLKLKPPVPGVYFPEDRDLAKALCRMIEENDPGKVIYVPPGKNLQKVRRCLGHLGVSVEVQ